MPQAFDSNTQQGGRDPNLQGLGSADLAKRLATIQKASATLLPSEVVLNLAQTDTPNERLHATALKLSRLFDVSPVGVFDPVSWQRGGPRQSIFVDHRHGKLLSFAQAKSMLQPYNTQLIAALLKPLFAPQPSNITGLARPTQQGVKREPRIKPGAVVRNMVALSGVDGHALSAAEAYAFSIQGARLGVDPDLLKSNVDFVTHQAPGIPIRQSLNAALVAAAQGIRITAPEQAFYLATTDTERNRLDGIINSQVAPIVRRQNPSVDTTNPLIVIGEARQQGIINLNPLIAGIQIDPNSTTTFDEQTQSIIDSLHYQSNWGDNLLGKIMQPTAHAVGVVGHYGSKLLMMATMPFVTSLQQSPLTAGAAAPLVANYQILADINRARQGQPLVDWSKMNDISTQMRLYKQAWEGKTYGGQIMQDQLALPTWTAPVLDIALSFIVAPDAIALGALKDLREARVLTTAATGEVNQEYVGIVTKMFTDEHRSLGGKTVAEFLRDAATNSADAEGFFFQQMKRFRGRFGAEGLSRTTSWKLYDYIHAATDAGVAPAEIDRNVRNVLLMSFGLRPPTDSQAARLVSALDTESANRAAALQKEAANIASELDFWDQMPTSLYGEPQRGVSLEDHLIAQIDDTDPEFIRRMDTARANGLLTPSPTLPEGVQTSNFEVPAGIHNVYAEGDQVRFLTDIGDQIDVPVEGRIVKASEHSVDDGQTLIVVDAEGNRHTVLTAAQPTEPLGVKHTLYAVPEPTPEQLHEQMTLLDMPPGSSLDPPAVSSRTGEAPWWRTEPGDMPPGDVRSVEDYVAQNHETYIYHGTSPDLAPGINEKGILTPESRGQALTQEQFDQIDFPFMNDGVYFGDFQRASEHGGAVYRVDLNDLKGRIFEVATDVGEDGTTTYDFVITGDVSPSIIQRVDPATRTPYPHEGLSVITTKGERSIEAIDTTKGLKVRFAGETRWRRWDTVVADTEKANAAAEQAARNLQMLHDKGIQVGDIVTLSGKGRGWVVSIDEATGEARVVVERGGPARRVLGDDIGSVIGMSATKPADFDQAILDSASELGPRFDAERITDPSIAAASPLPETPAPGIDPATLPRGAGFRDWERIQAETAPILDTDPRVQERIQELQRLNIDPTQSHVLQIKQDIMASDAIEAGRHEPVAPHDFGGWEPGPGAPDTPLAAPPGSPPAPEVVWQHMSLGNEMPADINGRILRSGKDGSLYEFASSSQPTKRAFIFVPSEPNAVLPFRTIGPDDLKAYNSALKASDELGPMPARARIVPVGPEEGGTIGGIDPKKAPFSVGRSLDEAAVLSPEEVARDIKLSIARDRDIANAAEIAQGRARSVELNQKKVEALLKTSPRTPREDMQMLDEWDHFFADHLAVQFEVPFIARRGGPRWLSSTLSERWGDSSLWRRASGLGSSVTGRTRGFLRWDIEAPDAVQNFEQVLRRSRALGADEIASASHDMTEALASSTRERAAGQVARKWNDVMVSRIGAEYGFTKAQLDEFMHASELFKAKQTYAVLDVLSPDTLKTLRKMGLTEGETIDQSVVLHGGIELNTPQFATQLQNSLDFVDPVWLRRGLSQATGTMRHFQRMLDAGYDIIRGARADLNTYSRVDLLALAGQTARKVLDPQLADRVEAYLAKSKVQNFGEFEARLAKGVKGMEVSDANYLIAAMKAQAPEFRPGLLTARALQGHTAITLPSVFAKTYDLLVRDLFLSWWKPLQVIRPAYMTRVVVIEEQARFLATAGLLSRMESGRWTSRGLAAFRDNPLGRALLGEADMAIPLRYIDEADGSYKAIYLPAYPGARIDATTGELLSKSEAAIAAAPEGVTVKTRFGRTAEGTGHGVIQVPEEALIRNGVSKLMLPSAERLTPGWFKQLTESYGSILRDKPQFFDSWAHDLLFQMANDPAGAALLTGIRDLSGDVSDRLRNALFNYYKTNPEGQRIATRLLGANAALEDEAIARLADRQYNVVKQYVGMTGDVATDASRSIARGALDGSLDSSMLRSIDKSMANKGLEGFSTPSAVHGAELQNGLFQRGETMLDKTVGLAADAILKLPTDALSRQPFFRYWYDRSLEGLHSLARDQGVVITERMLKDMQALARRYAIGRVQRIMFDFTRESRFGELLNFIIPFWQPFGEAFTVWGRIAAENPYLIAVLPRLYQGAKQSGAIYTDPQTGQDTFNAGWMVRAVLSHQIFSVLQTNPMSFSAPVASINFLINQTLPVPVDGLNVSVPFPSISPPFQWLIQKWFDGHSLGADAVPPWLRQRLSPWVIGYGRFTSATDLMPSYMRHFVRGFLGVDQNDLKAQADKFAQLMWQMGYSPYQQMPGADGNVTLVPREDPPPGTDPSIYAGYSPSDRVRAWNAWIAQEAMNQAQSLELARGWWSLFLPMAPRVSFPTEELSNELSDYRSRFGWVEGGKKWLAKYPDHPEYAILETASSIWNPDPTGKNPLELSPIALPANSFVDEFLRLPYTQQFAKEYPEWVWAIIPSELRNAKEDTVASFYQQIDQSFRQMRSPMEVQESTEASMGWDAYFTISNAWKNWKETVGQNVSENSATYDAAHQSIYADPLAELQRTNYAWAKEFGSISTTGTDPNVLLHAQALAQNKYLVSHFDVIAGLKEYMDLRSATAEQLRALHVTSLDSTAATDVRKNFDAEVAAIVQKHPDFQTALDLFFSGDLQHLQSPRERALRDAPPDIVSSLSNYDAEHKAASQRIDMATSGSALSDAYNNLRNVENRAYTEFPTKYNPLILDWENLSTVEQATRKIGMLGTPYAFLSQFRRDYVLGEHTDAATQAIWDAYGQSYADIQRASEAGASNIGNRYDALSKQMAQQAASNPTLAEQLRHANDWTWKAQQLIPDAANPGDPSYAYWQAFLDAVHTVQVIDTTQKWHGREQGFKSLKAQLWNYAQQLMSASHDFEVSYRQVEENYTGGTVMDALVPDTYYPIGGNLYVSNTRTTTSGPASDPTGYLLDPNTLQQVWGNA